MGSESTSPERPTRKWLTERETAERLNLSVKWLQKQRLAGGAPRYAKFGSAVRYSIADIEAFEQNALRTSTSDLGPAAGGAAK